MVYLYILKSQKDGDLYIGCSRDLKTRFKRYNAGLVASTKERRPLKLVYHEAYASESEAWHRESSLKLRGRARKQLLSRIKQSIEKI